MKNFLLQNDKYWSNRAEGYSRVNIDELHSTKKKEWIEIIKSNMPSVNKNIKVLDIGTGPGFFAILMASMGLDITAIDYNDEMLNKAKENSGEYKNSIKFMKMDAHELEFEDNTFDLIVTRNLTWNLKDPIKAYKEWHRVLNKGGRMINFDANWYNHLFNDKKRKEYEKDRENVANSKFEDHYTCTDIDEMEEIARKLPFSKIDRPSWDIKELYRLGASKVLVEENIGEILWSEEEKLNYASTPMFMIVSEK